MILIEYVSALNAVTIKIILKNVFFLILEIIFKDHGLWLKHTTWLNMFLTIHPGGTHGCNVNVFLEKQT
jgi:hypothetical protein